ncbi:MAG: signal peptide peptidase SppA [Phycisphaerae bacterium]
MHKRGKWAKLVMAAAWAGVMALPALAEETSKVVHLRLRGALAEAPPEFQLNLFGGGEQAPNLFDLLLQMREMRGDASVKALIVDLDEAALDLAQVQEMRQQFEALRAAGKDVWVYSEAPSLGQLMLASAASKVVMMPRGDVDVVGIYAAPMYFKGLLDKIGAEADVVHCGAYKAAGEPFSRTGPSKEAEEDVNRILDGVYDTVVTNIAKSRKLDRAAVEKFVDSGPHSVADAVDAGLVDELQYREDFLKSVRKKYGRETKIVHDYGKKKGPDVDFENPFAIFKLFGELARGQKKSDKNAIAVIYVDSMITTGRSERGFSTSSGSDTIRKAFDDAAKDDAIKAVVLRVDSPGGSAIASEVIAEAAKRCKGKKPFVVSMGGVAASGGYYVSCLADRIFAQPGTITGSIGVIGMKLVTGGVWNSIGISRHEYKRGAQADMMGSQRPWSEEQRKRILGLMTRVYGEFKDRVVEGRGKKLSREIESLAGGRVYTGTQGLKAGLVDELGGFDDAIRFAADQAKISDYELRVLPEPKTVFDILAEGMGLREKDEDDVCVSLNPGLGVLGLPTIQSALLSLQALDPRSADELRRGLLQLQAMSRDNVLMVAPGLPEIR